MVVKEDGEGPLRALFLCVKIRPKKRDNKDEGVSMRIFKFIFFDTLCGEWDWQKSQWLYHLISTWRHHAGETEE
jgi:hypothetical protein